MLVSCMVVIIHLLGYLRPLRQVASMPTGRVLLLSQRGWQLLRNED